ncbi:Predicted arabinose efflux permease, MFS family [Andreprevotia lacus DSM 23236]|jgi:MFS family permease|uniref:Predicted arabinose efflux permease, MFS family n=1 Tax=Andreprevotia lacus DSM 23236 TaxID=1121001 RepID=A0A1W1Y1C4_9NEIS|nr:MFS transporter [Andreprevotia lacus]SMC29937.1 Predicted arabinose efflux permease, MFS family [Andreprevotia lacus DSM 23236]
MPGTITLDTRAFLQRHRFMLSFVLLNALAGLGVGVAKVATTLYALDLGSSASQLSLIAAAQSVGVLLMSIPVGVLVDQFGPRRLFVSGSVLVAAGYLLVPVVAAPFYLALMSMLISFCMPTRFVSLNAVFMQQLEQVGVARAGWFRGSHMIGFFLLGPMLAVAILGVAGFAATFWIVAALFVLTGALAPLVMRVYRRPAVPTRKLSLAELRSQFVLMWRDTDLRSVCVIEFVAQALNQFYTFFIVAIAIKGYGMAPATAASLVSVQGAVFVLALFTLGALAARLGQVRFYLGSYAVLALALALLGLSRWPVLLWLGAGCLGLGLGMLQTVNVSRFAHIGARAGRGSIAGINAFVGPSGSFAGSVIGGALGAWCGLQAVFLLFVPLFAMLGWRLLGRDTAVAPAAAGVPAVQLESES